MLSSLSDKKYGFKEWLFENLSNIPQAEAISYPNQEFYNAIAQLKDLSYNYVRNARKHWVFKLRTFDDLFTHSTLEMEITVFVKIVRGKKVACLSAVYDVPVKYKLKQDFFVGNTYKKGKRYHYSNPVYFTKELPKRFATSQTATKFGL